MLSLPACHTTPNNTVQIYRLLTGWHTPTASCFAVCWQVQLDKFVAYLVCLLCGRWGPTGQGRLLCDIHSALIRVLEGLDEDLMEAPTMAGYGSATDLAPQDAYRPLLGASWPELARRYLQDHGSLTISQEAVDAVLRLKVPLTVCVVFCSAQAVSRQT